MLDDPLTPPEFSQTVPDHETIPSKSTTWEEMPRLTVLKALNGKKCSKIYSPAGVRKYDKAYEFFHWQISVEDFNGLAELLTDLESHDDQLIVMGRVTELFRNQTQIHRRKKPRSGQPASIEDAGSQIAVFDCDDIDVPDGFGWHDPAALAQAIWGILTDRIPALKNVSVFWQASASAGQPNVSDKAKFHFWVLLDSPLFEQQKRILYTNAGTDAQLSCPIQPHYIGRPGFVDVDDPLKSLPRSGVLNGDSERVCVADLDLEERKMFTTTPKVETQKLRAAEAPTLQRNTSSSTWAERQLDQACGLILSADARNAEINKQAFFIGGAVAKGLIPKEDAYDRLKEAAAATGHDRFEKALENGFRDGLKSPLKWNSTPEKPKITAPYHKRASEDRQAAVDNSRAMIRTWARDAVEFERSQGSEFAPRAMQHGMQGGGKTSALVGRVSDSEEGSQSGQKQTTAGALHHAVGLVSAIYMPTHAKCEEAAQVYSDCAPKGAPPSIVIRGRNQPDPDGEKDQKMCMVSELADRVAKQGATVRSTLCIKCPFQARCGYMKQERLVEQHVQSGTGLVVFAPHSYAFLPLPAETHSDLAIFDESPGSTVLDRISISLPDLMFSLQYGGTSLHISKQGAAKAADAAADAREIASDLVEPTLKAIASTYCPERGLDLKKLRQSGVDSERLKEVLEALSVFRDKRVPKILGGLLSKSSKEDSVSLASQKARRFAKKFQEDSGPRMDHLQVFLEILKSELELGFQWPIAIASQGGSAGDLAAVRLRPLTHSVDKPFLYIDGTGDPDLAKIMFGADLKPYLFAAERNARVIQIIGSRFSTKYVLGETADKDVVEGMISEKSATLRKRLKIVLDRSPDAAVFATKKVEDALGLTVEERAGHFNAVRGLNQWQDRQEAIIIGREQPPISEIEMTARAFAARIGEPFESSDPVWEWRGIRTREKEGSHPVIVMTHPNPLVEKLLHQAREAEVEQAIDRLRLVHNQQPKEVIILNEIAINITVDRIVNWRDFWRGGTRPERAAQLHGFLPLNGQEAVTMFPEIWSNRETANRDLTIYRSLVSESAYEDILYTKSDAKVVCHIRYKRDVSKPQRAHWRDGLVYCPRDLALEKMEKLIGKLKELEVLEEYEV